MWIKHYENSEALSLSTDILRKPIEKRRRCIPTTVKCWSQYNKFSRPFQLSSKITILHSELYGPAKSKNFVIIVSNIVVFDDQKGWFEEIALPGAKWYGRDEKLILKSMFL